MERIKCLVVDDEELARTLLRTYIDRLDFLELVGTVESPVDALGILKQQPIDVLFLDIQMPEIRGTDFAKIVPSTTRIIFTTAYSEYALEGYELDVLDYLLKPITFERFLAAVDKVKKNPILHDMANAITVKSGYDLYRVRFNDILYIESDSEYVHFHTVDKKIISYRSLKQLTEVLPAHSFMRVHRSFIVNKEKVTVLKGHKIYIGERTIPVSLQYLDAVKKKLF